MKYYADFSTSNGTYNSESYKFNSKREAIKSIREIGVSNTFIGGSVNVSVVDNNGAIVYEKTIFVK